MDSPRRSCDRRGVASVGSYGSAWTSERCAGKPLQKRSGKWLDVASACPVANRTVPFADTPPGSAGRRRPRWRADRPKSRDLMGFSRIATLVMVLALGYVAAASAQQREDTPPSSEPADTAPIDPDALPVSFNRIQKALSHPPAIRPESVRPVFRVEVFSRTPTIDDILGPNWRQGPTPLGAMTHQEFLDLVTPTDVKGYAAFDNRQALTVAATSFALKWGVAKAIKKLDEAITEHEK